jgi:hypothetical protein
MLKIVLMGFGMVHNLLVLLVWETQQESTQSKGDTSQKYSVTKGANGKIYGTTPEDSDVGSSLLYPTKLIGI